MYENKSISVVIAAAGAGTRMGGGLPKQYRDIQGKPMLAHAVMAFWDSPYIDNVLLVVSKDYDERILEFLPDQTILLSGGQERQDSIYNGLRALPPETDYVLVHDGARPFVSVELIERVIKATLASGAAVPCIKPKDTVRTREETLSRDSLYLVQTPQGFSVELLLKAYEEAFERGYYGTDEASLVERIGHPVTIIDGEEKNIKITTEEDMAVDIPEGVAGNILEGIPGVMVGVRGSRVGLGYDLHTLVEGRKLVLGGVEISYCKGLLGHSDADVVSHAVMDAILGALGEGDIGHHFPDSEEKYRGISSLKLLEEVVDLMERKAFELINLDICIMAEQPKIAPYIAEMKKKLASYLKVEEESINIKGTTLEGIGIVGREEGIACEALVLLKENQEV